MSEKLLTTLSTLPLLEPVITGSPLTSPFPLERVVEYLGVVNYGTTDRVLKEIKTLVYLDPQKDIYLTVTSAGGPSGIAMSFYDQLHSIVRPNLVTIGSGDVDSAGVIIFMSGERRYVTRHTTMLLHLAGRYFDPKRRYTAEDMASMAREDALKDRQYADIVAKRSHGKLTARKVMNLMRKSAVLTADDLVRLGFADGILG